MTTLLEIQTIARRAQHTLMQDVLGLVALVVMLLVGLHLPGFL